jgi:uncharacterized DUF497 family protein
MNGFRLGNLQFEWDDAKAASNVFKHEVTFEEAATAFLDKQAERIRDAKHSETEERFLLLAESVGKRILVVCHTVRGLNLRIISARLAKLRERRRYEDVRNGRR